MPPQLALLLYLGLVVWLFRRDFRKDPKVTRALWIPFFWFIITITRTVSEWFAVFGLHVGGSSMQEGSPVDALFSFILIVLGARVLAKRHVTLGKAVPYNQWLAIFFIYCFLAVFWSDFPFVAFKRWIKVLGHPIIAMVLLTEPDFELALIVLMKRCAYIVVPISMLFIKYFPALGRGFSEWTGQPSNQGITMGKNALGVDCLILGFFFSWYLLKILPLPKSRWRRNELILCAVFLGAIGWLLHMAQSSTSLVSLAVGIFIMLMLGRRSIQKHRVGTYILAIVALCAAAEYVFGISDYAFELLGRNRTLTDRTLVWADCLSIHINPILGVGFESFWLGERQQIMNSKWYWHPNEAHNGYLETYLNLGLVGLFILIALLLATFLKARRELLWNFHFGRFRVGFFCALLIYNWTESSFKALHPMWFVFYLVALDYPKPEPEPEPVVTTSEPLLDPGETDDEFLVPGEARGRIQV
jgi:exopolysaccharide production protein ExoQ